MPVPNTFANATTTIPLSNFNTVTTLNNMTFANVTISSVSTPLTAAQGGTGLTTLASENVIIGNAASAVKTVAPGTSGNVLTSTGSVWASQAPGAVTGNVTIGNTTIALGGTATTVGNLTLTNTTVTDYTETRFTANSSTAITLSLVNPTVTATASRLDIYSFFSDGTNWYGVTVNQNYTP